MPIIATAGNSTARKLAPEGNHAARCCQIVHVGTSFNEKFGNKKDAVRITWELPLETTVFKEGGKEEPFLVSKEYRLSLNEKSVLRRHLESWRGQAFSDKELKGFDISTLLGKPCMIQVIHSTTSDGNGFNEIASISSVPKGYVVPDLYNDSYIWDVLNFDEKMFDAFPDWLKDKIKATDEYKEWLGNGKKSKTADDLPF